MVIKILYTIIHEIILSYSYRSSELFLSFVRTANTGVRLSELFLSFVRTANYTVLFLSFVRTANYTVLLLSFVRAAKRGERPIEPSSEFRSRRRYVYVYIYIYILYVLCVYTDSRSNVYYCITCIYI